MVVRVRKLRSWLLGLYIAAQVIGFAPLIYQHTLNVYKAVPVAGRAELASGTTQHEPDHHNGFIDSHDQCCSRLLAATSGVTGLDH